MFIRFIVVYLICILVVFIPLYYLFNISEMDPGKLNLPKKEGKEQNNVSDRFQIIMLKLDSVIALKDMVIERTSYMIKLNNLKDSISPNDPSKLLLLKIYDLYKSKIALNDTLVARTDRLTQQLNKSMQEKKDCEDAKNNLLKILQPPK